MKLPASDIDRVDARGAAGEQHVREAARRRAHIEADLAGRIDGEGVERGCELHAAAGDPGMRCLGSYYGFTRARRRGLADYDPTRRPQPRLDRRPRLGAAVEQT